MTNSKVLKEKICLSGLKIRSIASQMGISYQAFYNKVNGKSEFVASEIVFLTQLLKLSKKEQADIFFNVNVGK